jgi:hypothetical protein
LCGRIQHTIVKCLQPNTDVLALHLYSLLVRR